jgi:hypothetical protein
LTIRSISSLGSALPPEMVIDCSLPVPGPWRSRARCRWRRCRR